MVERSLPLYEHTRSHFTKRLNLALRGWIYRWTYLPKLQHFGVFDEAEHALEIGTGYGTKLHHTVQRVPATTFRGLEPSATMRQRGHQWYPAVSDLVEVGEAENLLTISDQSQDVLMYYQVLHHLDWHQLEQAMKEAERVLRPGGKVAIIDTFLDQDPSGWGQARRVVFHTIEPVYNLISTSAQAGYKNQPQQAFIEFMKSYGFSLKHQSQPFGALSVSEILVFEKNA